MSDDLEQAAQTAAEHAVAATVGQDGPVKARKSRPAALRADAPDGVCTNCGATLKGPVCHMCGQVDDEYHRPAHGLLRETVEGVLSLDGRVTRTIPALLLWPGKVTRAYLKGQRARYMPPFRLYIIASLIFFLLAPALDAQWAEFQDGLNEGWNNYGETIAESGGGEDGALDAIHRELDEAIQTGDLTDEESEAARQSLAYLQQLGLSPPADKGAEPQRSEAGLTQPASGERVNKLAAEHDTATPYSWAEPLQVDLDALPEKTLANPNEATNDSGIVISPFDGANTENIMRLLVPEDFGEPAPDTASSVQTRRYLGQRLGYVVDNPGDWLEASYEWVPRIMFAMVPVYALLLGGVYVWRRGYFLYDHMIVSLHFHAALFLSMSIVMKAAIFVGAGWSVTVIFLYSNLYLYKLHRVVYERGRISSALRTLTLNTLYGIVLLFGMVAVLLLGAVSG